MLQFSSSVNLQAVKRRRSFLSQVGDTPIAQWKVQCPT